MRIWVAPRSQRGTCTPWAAIRSSLQVLQIAQGPGHRGPVAGGAGQTRTDFGAERGHDGERIAVVQRAIAQAGRLIEQIGGIGVGLDVDRAWGCGDCRSVPAAMTATSVRAAVARVRPQPGAQSSSGLITSSSGGAVEPDFSRSAGAGYARPARD